MRGFSGSRWCLFNYMGDFLIQVFYVLYIVQKRKDTGMRGRPP
jgi:hypothetical protein